MTYKGWYTIKPNQPTIYIIERRFEYPQNKYFSEIRIILAIKQMVVEFTFIENDREKKTNLNYWMTYNIYIYVYIYIYIYIKLENTQKIFIWLS